jgi:hypothetical protein
MNDIDLRLDKLLFGYLNGELKPTSSYADLKTVLNDKFY